MANASDSRIVRVRLVQVNFTYGPNAYLPYSVGLLQAAVQSDPLLAPLVTFDPIQFLREPIDESARSAVGADVVGLSAYIWNWEYVKSLARRIKQVSPQSFVLVGGPQVPHSAEDLFTKHPYFDAVAVGEGEETFVALVSAFVNSGREGSVNLGLVDGLVLQGEEQRPIHTGHRARVLDLESLPSPYLSGVFDSMVKEFPEIQFQASQETHRGCPYSCTFCDWGSATMQKVRKFDPARITAEYRWMASSGIEVLYNCDANFGLFPDDEELTDELVKTKNEFGFPKKFRAAYAKNSNERVFRIAKTLNDAEMSKGVTLSLQSLSTETLEAIKRRNMRINNFQELIDMYVSEGIPTYTELIAGLPGETLESFRSGIAILLDAGQHDGLNIYPTMVLPNAQLNEPGYRDLHAIRTVETPMLLSHGSRQDEGPQETYEIVVETRTMSENDFEEMMIFGWLVQALHCMNLAQYVARVLRHLKRVEFSDFYADIVANPSFSSSLDRDLDLLRKIVRDVINGRGSLDLEDDRFGSIVWPVEEILFLRLASERFTLDLQSLLTDQYGMTDEQAHDLVQFQLFSLRDWRNELDGHESLDCSSDWLALADGDLEGLGRSTRYVRIQQGQFESREHYAREVVWYGRKGASMRMPIRSSAGLAPALVVNP